MTKRVALLRLPILFSAVLSIAACGTRSISNSGYQADSSHSSYPAGNPFYTGELSEFDVLGAAGNGTITDEDIQKSFAARRPLAIAKGSPVMLVQSGAIFPDDSMVKSLAAYYPVVGFSGIPEQTAYDPSKCANPLPPYAMALRLLAARGGYEKIVVYWGILETAQEDLATKAVSWIPIIGSNIADQKQRMRIRLKVAVVDVRSGQWETFVPEPIESAATNADNARVSSDRGQVAALKEAGYKAAADEIVRRYGS
jgi:hypothetical protein